MSDACVTDSFARAKEAWSGSIRSPYPDGAQAAGRIHPLKVCVTAAAVVNPGCGPGCGLTDFNAEEAAGSPLSAAGQTFLRRFSWFRSEAAEGSKAAPENLPIAARTLRRGRGAAGARGRCA